MLFATCFGINNSDDDDNVYAIQFGSKAFIYEKVILQELTDASRDKFIHRDLTGSIEILFSVGSFTSGLKCCIDESIENVALLSSSNETNNDGNRLKDTSGYNFLMGLMGVSTDSTPTVLRKASSVDAKYDYTNTKSYDKAAGDVAHLIQMANKSIDKILEDIEMKGKAWHKVPYSDSLSVISGSTSIVKVFKVSVTLSVDMKSLIKRLKLVGAISALSPNLSVVITNPGSTINGSSRSRVLSQHLILSPSASSRGFLKQTASQDSNRSASVIIMEQPLHWNPDEIQSVPEVEGEEGNDLHEI